MYSAHDVLCAFLTYLREGIFHDVQIWYKGTNGHSIDQTNFSIVLREKGTASYHIMTFVIFIQQNPPIHLLSSIHTNCAFGLSNTHKTFLQRTLSDPAPSEI